MEPSRLERLPVLSERLGVDLYVKRDDLLPLSGGGSKVRKALRIMADVERQGYDAVVTTGGLQSNHARVVALESARRQWACRLVLHGDPAALESPSGNLLLMVLAGAQIDVMAPERIPAGIDAAVAGLEAVGHLPHVIPGGGHCLEGALAFVEAATELAAQCRALDWLPDVVVHASGTGATQGGLLAGFDRLGLGVRVIGISVARRAASGRSHVSQSYAEASSSIGTLPDDNAVEFDDRWVDGGYGMSTSATIDVIRMAARTEGLILDPVYTGKAFRALVDLVRGESIGRRARVVFWHTGGLPNLLSGAASMRGGEPFAIPA